MASCRIEGIFLSGIVRKIIFALPNKEIRFVLLTVIGLLKIEILFFMYYSITSYMFCYPLFFISRKIFTVFTTILKFFMFFFLQKDFNFFHVHIFTFCFFLLWKDFNTFHEPLFKPFLFLLIISSWNFYIC